MVGGGIEYGAKPRVVQVGVAECEWIGAGSGRELIHEDLAREIVGRGGEPAVGAVTQRRSGGHETAIRFPDDVRRVHRVGAGVDVDEMPGRDFALGIQAGLRFDDAGGTEIGPGEFLLAGPAQGDRLARGPGEARRLDRVFARVFAAEGSPEIRDDHAHLVLGDVECARQFAANTEGILRAGPDGELAILPLRNRCPRLERGVLDVGDMVAAA